MKRNRIGIFGGTFDPPHLGHLILAEEIREDFELAEVYFMACNEPPHKDRPDLMPAKHRFAMVVAATLHNPAFVASPIEVNRPGRSYSIDTLRILGEQLADDTEVLFISGLDSFLEIETWKEYEALLDACHMIVVSRPGHRLDEIREGLPGWIVDRAVDLRGDEDPRDYLDGGVETTADPLSSRRQRDDASVSAGAAEGDAQPHAPPTPPRVFLSDGVHVDISSTEIRDRVRQGRSIRYRVPAEVEAYIEANGLYREAVSVKEAVS